MVEAAAGQSLDACFGEHILGPLGMSQTTFLMHEAQRANSVPVHLHGEDGAWQAAPEVDWSREREWWAGGHGLHRRRASTFWVDRSTGVTGAIYAQTLPFVEPQAYQVYVDFERALYASIGTGTFRSRRFERVPEEARQTTEAS